MPDFTHTKHLDPYPCDYRKVRVLTVGGGDVHLQLTEGHLCTTTFMRADEARELSAALLVAAGHAEDERECLGY